MNNLNLVKMSQGLQTAFTKHAPEILMAVGVVGMVTTTVMAVRITPKALRLMEAAEVEKSRSLGQGSESTIGELTPIEVVKTTWKCYIPAAVTGAVSIACLIGASSVNARRNAALATAYTLSEVALKEYQGKVVETIGEKKEQIVRDSIAKDKVDRNPVSKQEVIITDRGNTLCFDTISGRYFKCDIDKLKRVENDLNRNMLSDMYVSLNGFYYEIGLPPTKMGDDLGWNVNSGFIELEFSSQLADDGTPCLVLDYQVVPKHGYQSY